MKKRALFLTLLLSLIVCSFVLVGCNDSVIPNKISIEYKDADGTSLQVYEMNEGDSVPSYDLPSDNEKWDYTEWSKNEEIGKIEFLAQRVPQRSYFVGNVFQIIGKDFMGTPILSGTGFVVDSNGLFVTNDHVMEEAYEVSAYFEIRNATEGETYTVLPVEIGYYNDADKDLFIGRITDYSTIVQYYKPIGFNTEHIIGGTTYSVGYPNSVPNMEINKGVSYEDANFLADKLFGNISIILSSSYIAHGSSGGILVDNDLSVVGITTRGWTDDEDEFLCGGSINAFNVVPKITAAKTLNAQYITSIYHASELVNMKIFRGLADLNDARMDEYEGEALCINTGTVEGTNNENVPYSCTTTTYMTQSYFLVHEEKYQWGDGDKREMSFYGTYDDDIGLESLDFSFTYTWASGSYYTLTSTNVNYSETVSLTLANYSINKSIGTTVSESNITYAKERFNDFYDSFMYLLANMWINATNLDADNHHIILIGTSADYEPFAYQQDGTLTGFEIELMKELCKEMGYEPEFVVMTFDEIFTGLDDDSLLCSISAITKTDSRDNSYTSSDVYYVEDGDSYVIYSAFGNTNLAGKINTALAQLKSNGIYDSLMDKYGL